jgi:hypothetical protein
MTQEFTHDADAVLQRAVRAGALVAWSSLWSPIGTAGSRGCGYGVIRSTQSRWHPRRATG